MKKKWLLFIICLMVTGSVMAASVVSPIVPGYNGAASTFRAAAGAFTMSPANDAYIVQSIVQVGGSAIKVPATMRIAANAAEFAKVGMRLNPWLLAGSLALPWLIDHAITPTPDGTGLTIANGTSSLQINSINYPIAKTQPDGQMCFQDTWPSCIGTTMSGYSQPSNANSDGSGGCGIPAGHYFIRGYNNCGVSPKLNIRPATKEDFDQLPSPIPAVAPELPHAPYLPDGAPVGQPEYAPADVPVGEPYTKPDGSTAQPRVKISPAGDGKVTLAPYDQPLTDPSGQPTPDAPPVATPDQTPDFCVAHPDSIACAKMGEPPTFDPPPPGELPKDPKLLPAAAAISWHNQYLPESSACPLHDIPLDVMGAQVAIPMSSICPYLDAIKALVIGMSVLAAIRLFALAPW